MALFGRFFGRAAAEGAGFAFGRASAPVLSPALEELRQEAWKVYSTRVPDVAVLAAGVAEGKVDESEAREWATRHGFGQTSFDALVAIAQTGPDVGQAMAAWRRGLLTEPQFRTVLKRHGIEPQWNDALEGLKQDILSPGELAAAIHRGLVPDPGLLKGEQPAPPFKVEAYPVYPIDAVQEAEGSGYDKDRLGVLVGLQGFPMGTHEAAQAYFRGIIEHGDYIRAFNESNSRNEWAQAVLDQTRQIPTARDSMENALRGYHDLQWAIEQAARHGMSPEDALIIYQNQGRPMAVSNIQKALARGGVFKPQPGELTDPFEASIVEGNLKPAYYDLAKQLRFTMPSAFAIRQLAQSGVWDAAQTAKVLKESGWVPEYADQVAAAWASNSSAATAQPWAKRAETQLWTATHKGYIGGEVTESEADAALVSIGVGQQERAEVFRLWNEEKNITVKPLTPSQIKRAYKSNELTIDDAVARLELQHYTDADARTYLTS